MAYSNTNLFIAGIWTPGSLGRTIEVFDPATGETIGHVARAEIDDLDRALGAADQGFRIWRATSAFERGKILRQRDSLGDCTLLRSEPSEVLLFVIVERGLTSHDQPGGSTRCQWRVDLNDCHG